MPFRNGSGLSSSTPTRMDSCVSTLKSSRVRVDSSSSSEQEGGEAAQRRKGMMRRCSSTSSSTPEMRTKPEEVAERLQRLYHTKGDVKDFFVEEKGSFVDPLLWVSENTSVILLLFWAMRLVWHTVDYKVDSCFRVRRGQDRVLVEARVTYKWRRPFAFLQNKITFRVYHTVFIDEQTDDQDVTTWRCTKLDEVWDHNALSLVAYVITAPMVFVLARLCALYNTLFPSKTD
eukprot:Hpha_TRINITY_DN13641_c0_g4::TRINITY_DN13641_c0_g4_i1::g.122832::m.122832